MKIEAVTRAIDQFDAAYNIQDNETTESVSFQDLMGEQIQAVNDSQLQADSLTNAMIAGEDVELHDVMIATEEAKISLQMAVEVRNKLIDAYNEIMKMNI
jgi:flagellar hook-basal body complex protein FliE